ncbi:MAG: AMP-binding protein [Rhodococcus sp. (in: high G+C Gram-positive bacteria)]
MSPVQPSTSRPDTAVRPLSALLGDSVLSALDGIAATLPTTTAFASRDDSITYGELAIAARNRGEALRCAHARANTGRMPLAVVIDGSVDSVISILAVFASGHPLFAVDADLPDVARSVLTEAAGAIEAASVDYYSQDQADNADDGMWWESRAWDRGLTEGGTSTALDAWRPALVLVGPGSTGRITVTQEELLSAASDLAARARLGPRESFAVSHSCASVAGLVGLVAGLLHGCTVSGVGRGFPTRRDLL